MLFDEVRGHWNYPTTKREFAGAQSRDLWEQAACIRVEDKANGSALIAELEELEELHVPITPVEPIGSKEERLKRHSAKFQARMRA